MMTARAGAPIEHGGAKVPISKDSSLELWHAVAARQHNDDAGAISARQDEHMGSFYYLKMHLERLKGRVQDLCRHLILAGPSSGVE